MVSSSDWDLLHELEGKASARLREQAGAIHLVRAKDRRYGTGWTPVMAAFCHVNDNGSRFSDGTFGAYYCAKNEATAIAETRYHAELFMRESEEAPTLLPQRVYLANLEGELIELRGYPPGAEAFLAPDAWRSASPSAGRLGRPMPMGLSSVSPTELEMVETGAASRHAAGLSPRLAALQFQPSADHPSRMRAIS